MGFFDFFPYTNFHNVNLDWVLQRVKEWGELVQANDVAFHNLEEANQSFKEYVTNYLENLDVQAEIDDKLDRMFESGVLGEYLQPYVSPTITTWLNENITEPEGVIIDSSLTVSGACADAKAVGDAIKILEEKDSISAEVKRTLLACFRHVAWIDIHGQDYYDALENALYNSDWTYEWSASSGIAPSSDYFNCYEYDFTRYPDAMYVDNFYFDFNHVGDVEILFVAKMATEATLTTGRTPQISLRISQGSSGYGYYDGFKVVFNTPSGKVETNLSGDFTSVNIDYTDYHEYRVKYKNGVGYLYVDDMLLAHGSGVTNNQYIYMTGIFGSIMEGGHPNISISRAYTRMAIKSVKYKELS